MRHAGQRIQRESALRAADGQLGAVQNSAARKPAALLSEAELLLRDWSTKINIATRPVQEEEPRQPSAATRALEDLALDDAKSFIDSLLRKEIAPYVRCTL